MNAGIILYAAWLPVLALGTGYWAHAAWQRLHGRKHQS